MPVPKVQLGKLGFHVVRLGPEVGRTPVVFLHGLIIDNISTFYYTLAPVAAREHPVVCYDLRGHGFSDRPPDGYKLDDAVGDLVGILDALAIDEPVHLVGYSYGGTIAIATAAWRPERVASLVLVETEPAADGWSEEMVGNLEDVVAGFDDPSFREFLATEAPRALRKLTALCEELVTRSTLPADFRSSTRVEPEDLATLQCPTLLVYGDNSEILDVAFLLEDSIPHSELRIVDDCSHHVMVEAPDEVARHLSEWLEARSKVEVGA
jgi:pimeloyl-ACP methyl ester carboxylesterase